MEHIKKFEEWRAEEIVKVFLLKLDTKLSIEKYPTPLFDLFVQFDDGTQGKFAVEVKTKFKFKSSINRQSSQLKTYREAGMLNLPVILIKVDEKKEEGEFDFLIFPSFKENKLLIRNEFKFQKLTKENFENKINTIRKWYNEK